MANINGHDIYLVNILEQVFRTHFGLKVMRLELVFRCTLPKSGAVGTRVPQALRPKVRQLELEFRVQVGQKHSRNLALKGSVLKS